MGNDVMPVTIDTFILGPLATNAYVIRCGGEVWIVDPGDDEPAFMQYVQALGVSPSRILLTHGHGDHIAGVGALKKAYPAAVITCPAGDAAMLTDAVLNFSAAFGAYIVAPAADELVQPGQTLRCGGSEWQVLDAAGHSAGGVCYSCPQAKVVLVGDALFAGSIGRSDIPGGHCGLLIKNIRLHLLSLSDDTRVLSGHGPETTIGHERRSNPYLKDSYKGHIE